MSEAAISVQGVSHWFGSMQVLREVSFDVPKGSVFGFIGPNGAGKTTTLRMIATLLEPMDGRVLVDGYDVVEKPRDVRRVLGFMPDGYGVYERITVREYLEFFAAACDLPIGARDKAVEGTMELTDLGPLRERLVEGLSKGMKQRLAIARTLLHDPSVLVLDEPANGLDPRARIDMRDLILQLADLGKTIVLSSHILTELSDMVSAVAILERGTVRAAGSVDQIHRRVAPRKTLRLKLLAYPEGCEDVFRQVPGVLGVDNSPEGDLRIAHQGDDALVADVVSAAVMSGLRVIRVEPERENLEQIFLEVTRGELQ